MSRTIFVVFVCWSFISFSQGDTTEEFSDQTFYWYVPYQKSDGTWTLFERESQTVSDSFEFDNWLPGPIGVYGYIFSNNGFYGSISQMGDTILPFEYDTIIPLDGGVYTRKQDKHHIELESWQKGRETYSFQIDSLYVKGPFTYVYSKGQVGMIFDSKLVVPPNFSAVQPFNEIDVYYKSPILFLALEGDNFRFFDDKGEDLLGIAVPEFELMKLNYLKYMEDGRWKYINLFSGESFDSQGNDVVLYDDVIHKIYNASRTQSRLFVQGKEFNAYDDYFYLSPDYFAVRKNGRVGLMNNLGQTLVSPKYDKVEVIDLKNDYFKFFEGDSCGLMTGQGVELVPALYANILATPDPERFIILNNDQAGIIDIDGNVLLEPKYSYIQPEQDCFFLKKGDAIGLADIDGNVIFEPRFKSYLSINGNSRTDDFYAIMFKEFNGKLVLASREKILTKTAFDDFNYGNQVFKLYRSGSVEVLVLDDKTEVEDRQTYKNIGSFRVVGDFNSDRVSFGLSSWDYSYLEENQSNGKFGLRFFKKYGMAVEPVYSYVQPGDLKSFYGEVPKLETYSLIDGVDLKQTAVYDQMYIGSSSVENKHILASELFLYAYSAKSTNTTLVAGEDKHGKISVQYTRMPFSLSEQRTLSINASKRYLRDWPQKYIYEAVPELCGIDTADMSLYEYYWYYGALGGLHLDAISAKQIMRPDLGVKFVGGTRRISSINNHWTLKNRMKFGVADDYKDFHFSLNGDFFISKSFSKPDVWKVEDYMWEQVQEKVSTKQCYDFREYADRGVTTLELLLAEPQKIKIHADFPEFEFIEIEGGDSQYHAGRLILEDSLDWKLMDPTGKIFLSGKEEIRFMGADLFAVYENGFWKVYDRNGTLKNTREFTFIGNVSNDTYYAVYPKGTAIYRIDGSVVIENDESFTYVGDGKYRVRTSPEVWFDTKTGIYDTLREDESYLGAEIFLRKIEDDNYVLRFYGSNLNTEIKSDKKPQRYSNHVIFHWKKHAFVFSSKGEVQKFSKTDSPKAYGNFTVLEGKKERYILDRNGDLIYSSDEILRSKQKGDLLEITTSDTAYLLSQAGELFPFNYEESNISNNVEEVKVFKSDRGFGAMKGGKVVIEPQYESLKYEENGEFTVIKEFSWSLFDAELNQINKTPYTRYEFLDVDVLALEMNGRWYFYEKTDVWKPLF